LELLRLPTGEEMKHSVQRQYILSQDEVKCAIYDYLKKMDKPIPENFNKLEYAWNGHKECHVDYNDVIITP
jgi:mRNA-degrading endonuclease YafQ of YafQ-DinJ toxin-antitoxin module